MGDRAPARTRIGGRISRPSAAAIALKKIRQMVLEGVLLPGQPIRQELLAELLGMSRVPIREALKALEADGVVSYRLNTGFRVVKLSTVDLKQLYIMRQALERELLVRMPPPTGADVVALEGFNRGMQEAAEVNDIPEFIRLNRDFHFHMFERTGMSLIINELVRLWDAGERYNALYNYNLDTRQRIVTEHGGMIEALAAGDRDGLLKLADEHRHAGETGVVDIFRSADEGSVAADLPSIPRGGGASAPPQPGSTDNIPGSQRDF